MAVSKRVAITHEDWLNLCDPEPPWFTLPVMKRAFPEGLHPVASITRAEHKVRWDQTYNASDRTEYVDWLLRNGLGWLADYRAGDNLPPDLAAGVAEQGVTVTPTGAFIPPTPMPVGVFGDVEPDQTKPAPQMLVFVLAAGTDPASRPIDGWSANHIQRAAKCCRHFKVPLALVTDGDHLTLVHASADHATGWGTWRASAFATEPVLLDSFSTMLEARRFTAAAEADSPAALLAESVGSQAEVTDQLGFQVRRAVELLVSAISRADRSRDGALLAGVEPEQVYEAAVTVIMRLVILLVAEENDLLPTDDEQYRQLYAVHTLHESLEQERSENPEAMEARNSAWHRLLSTTRAVYAGVRHHSLSVPAYGSSLFDPDRFGFLEGRTSGQRWNESTGTPIEVTDSDVLAILNALLVLRFRSASGVTDTRRLSYRQVEVEQVGHVYEKLLDHSVLVADGPVLGCVGKRGDEPEIPLRDLEEAQMNGEDALLAFLTDKKGSNGHYVGTRAQVKKRLDDDPPASRLAELRASCGGDASLVERVKPFANLLRLDLRNRPVVFLPDAVYVTETRSNRASGTAYTTRELAEEVAQYALQPLCYSPGPQDSADANQWRLRSSQEILKLKVCDPAVGSGAILVAACRYLAERVVEAWAIEGNPRAASQTTADDPNRQAVVVDARRLAAERCCYGVDRNPMAAEMAKLSMWLTTMAKDRPFTFLDHAIKSGDSLLGIWEWDQLRCLHMDPAAGRQRDRAFSWMVGERDALEMLQDRLDEAALLRMELQSKSTDSIGDLDRKADQNARSERLLHGLGAAADLVVGAALASSQDRNPAGALNQIIEADLSVLQDLLIALDTPDEHTALKAAQRRATKRLDAGRPEDAPNRRPLHWPIAFPEVFADEGRFDAMIGNPPFIGGQRLSGAAGGDYREHLVRWTAEGATGSADLVAYFFLHADKVARSLGYLATNTIAQGDTSEVGLAQLIDRGWTIHRAVSSTPWPGRASLEIAKLWMSLANWHGQKHLDGRWVGGVDEMLYPASRSSWRKQPLAANKDQSFQGSIVLGTGFTVDLNEVASLLKKDEANREVLFPYLNGEDLNQSSSQAASRSIINFFDWPIEKAREYPHCFEIVEKYVKPERISKHGRDYETSRNFWWRYLRIRRDLYHAIGGLDRVLAIGRVSKTVMPAYVPASQVFSDATVVFAYDDWFHLGLLSSGFHFRWATRYASSLRTDTRYTPTDVFETFPQPDNSDAVADTAEALDNHRRPLMITEQLGLTSLYNRVHDPDDRDPAIGEMRRLHRNLDFAVRDAYGWHDIELDHGFHDVRGAGLRFTFAPEAADEILERLLELNRDRYLAEKRAGLHSKSKKKKTTPLGGLFQDLDEAST
ncbi:Eco57I restriction-modification methylase domain-containing protein [Candidatus Poriferisocius sp.]|uniref:Eco57I restriction-modification methylase domain-containing protein n=1 Tax=Candidatus Poriferisocius sp. TaxID=3101276 RepID=UPI003B5217BD